MIDSQLNETLKYIKKRINVKPQLGFILGSGLSGFAKEISISHEFAFNELPHFNGSTIEGHPGKLVLGQIEGVSVAVMLGRLHAYEGLSPQQVVYPVRTLARLGVRFLTVTNAAGGLLRKMRPGDFMLIRDHINMTGDNPLRGHNSALGPRFVDMTEPYDNQLSSLLKKALVKEKVRHHQGVYVGVLGPTYETAAEIRFFSKIGGDAVGMSTVAEVIAARHAGLRVAGLSLITNLGTGLHKKKLTHDEVKEAASLAEKKFRRVLTRFTRSIKPLL